MKVGLPGEVFPNLERWQVAKNEKDNTCIVPGLLCALVLFALLLRVMADKAPETSRSSYQHTKFQDGDIIFQTSRSGQSKAIQLATKSRYSHMGIIYETDGQLYVYEAVQPVKLTKLHDWIKRGEGSHFVVKRLRDNLTKDDLKKMKAIGEKFKGKSYDIYFEWSDDKIYCSELVWKIYNEALDIEIGALQELREFDLTSDVVKSKMKERYGDHIPLDEKVISPESMFQSIQLVTIEEQ